MTAAPQDGAPAYIDPVGNADRLIASAYQAISARYAVERHQIAAALLDADGTVHLGLHLDAMVGRAAVCAEAGALSTARLSTSAPLIAIAAVRHPKPTETMPARIVPPCGLCRELLLDYAPDIRVVLRESGLGEAVPLAELLPHKYVGTKWAATPPTTEPHP